MLGALRESRSPDGLLEDLSRLARPDLAAVAATVPDRWFRRPPRNPAPAQMLLNGYGAARDLLIAAAIDLLALRDVTGAPPAALIALARPYPAGVLAALPLEHLGALALLAPTHGWVRLWDDGRVPVPDEPTATTRYQTGDRLSPVGAAF